MARKTTDPREVERRREQQTAAKVAAYGELTPRERAARAYPLNTVGRLMMAPAGDFEEPPADLVVALGLVGAEASIDGYTHLGHLIVGSAEHPDGFVAHDPKHLRATYRTLTIPPGQFSVEG